MSRPQGTGPRSDTLECTPGTFAARTSGAGALTIARADPGESERCRRLGSDVGHGFWTERSRWSEARWRQHLEQPKVSFWVASVARQRAGCFEFTRSVRGVRMEGFGLLPSFRGRGLGRDQLTAGTGEAFASGAHRIWLHTATDDHPHALPNDLAGGFRILRDRVLVKPIRGAIPA